MIKAVYYLLGAHSLKKTYGFILTTHYHRCWKNLRQKSVCRLRCYMKAIL